MPKSKHRRKPGGRAASRPGRGLVHAFHPSVRLIVEEPEDGAHPADAWLRECEGARAAFGLTDADMELARKMVFLAKQGVIPIQVVPRKPDSAWLEELKCDKGH